MPILIKKTKPSLSLDYQPLCTFRSSKAYLWGLIYERLRTYSSLSSHAAPLQILDAACHASITRRMFPDIFIYHGIDISFSRLSTALKNSKSNDKFYRADIVQPLGISNFFDVIVSCNTLSHIPASSRLTALKNLCLALKVKGDLFVNVGLDSNTRHISQFLSSVFNSVEPIYFDSILSHDAERSKLINSDNVHDWVVKNESSLPNDGCLHSQVLFHAKTYLKSNDVMPPPVIINRSSSSIPVLNNISDSSLQTFPTDESFLLEVRKHLPSVLVVVSDPLFNSIDFLPLSNILSSYNVPYLSLSQLQSVSSSTSLIYLVGFEQEYVSDIASARLSINRLRQNPKLSLRYCYVQTRANLKLTASLLFSDI